MIVSQTWFSYPYNDFRTATLSNGTLLPDSPNTQPLSVSDGPVSDGDEPGWILTTLDLPTPAQIYCAVVRTSHKLINCRIG